MKRGILLVAGGLLLSVVPLMAQETASGLVGEYWQMDATDLMPDAALIQDFPTITDQKPALSRADATINLETSVDALPGTGLADNYYIRWTGKIRIAKEGQYTFYTESDDGSRLSIDGQAVVSNGGLHGAQEAAGSINLKPGDHDLSIEYFEATGDATMKASWSSADINRDIIPADVLWHKEAGKDALQPGLWGEYFDFSNGFPQPPTVRKADAKRVDKTINFEMTDGDFGNTAFSDNFFVRWTGTLKVPQDGKYTFYTESDDGSRLLIDGKVVVNNNGPHGMREMSGDSELKAGDHKITIEYFELGSDAGMKASWSGPNLDKAIIGENYLSHLKAAE